MNQLLTIREATKWAAMFLKKQVSTPNISYLIQYGRIRKFGENGEVLIDVADLENEVLVGKEFWDFLGGSSTYEDLLNVFREAGLELYDEIDEKMKNL